MKYYYLITNIGWNKNLHPVISLMDLETKVEKTFPVKDYDFKFQLSTERFCTGYFDLRLYPCPYSNIVEGRHTQCHFCEKKQGFKSAFLFRGVANEIAERYLSQPHFIYLAYFYPDTIKVGTASENRLDVRPVEQDALLYSFIAKVESGFEVQKLEREISKKFGLTEFVRSSQKLKNIEYEIDYQKAWKHLNSVIDRIFTNLSEEFQSSLIDRSEIKIVDFSKNLYYPKSKFTKIGNEDFLVGKFLGLRGRFLFLENHGNIFLFDTKYLIGKKAGNTDNYKYKIDQDDQLGLF